MTNASLTERQAILSTPFFLISSALPTKPGRCLAEQVGVNAPGSANNTVLPLPKISSLVMSFIFTDGILSPTLMGMSAVPLAFFGNWGGGGRPEGSAEWRLRNKRVRVRCQAPAGRQRPGAGRVQLAARAPSM